VSSSDERPPAAGRPLLKQQAVGLHIRELRTAAGLSLRSLAERTDFSPSFISQVENGQVSPSIASMERIATALGVTLGEFFAAAARGASGTVVRAADRTVLSSSWSAASVAALSPMSGHRHLEPVLITLEPGGRSGKHPTPHAAEEFAFVLEGEVTLTLGPERHQLSAGDAVTILPQELRLWENGGSRSARVLVVSAVGRG
jgi:XRE family transcriptional regulator, regulator of sulfur utilization